MTPVKDPEGHAPQVEICCFRPSKIFPQCFMKLYFTFLFVCICAHARPHALKCGVLAEARRGVRSSGAEVRGGYKSPAVFGELYPSLLLEPQALNLLGISSAQCSVVMFLRH